MEVSDNLHTQAKDQLRSIIDRIERLEGEKKALSDDIAEVYKEAKSNGFDVKTLKTIVSMRKKEEHRRMEEQAILSTYLHALGMLGDLASTPLGEAALASAPRPATLPADGRSASPATDAGADVSSARAEGDRAARDGKPISSSPYMSDSPKGRAWEAGFISANVHALEVA